MTNYTTEKADKTSICFHFRVPPGELRARAGTAGAQTGAAARTAMVRRAVDALVSDACRKAVSEYPDIVYFKPAGVPRVELEEVALTLDELEAATAAIEQSAIQASCETRRLVGQQAVAFTAAALPLCRVV